MGTKFIYIPDIARRLGNVVLVAAAGTLGLDMADLVFRSCVAGRSSHRMVHGTGEVRTGKPALSHRLLMQDGGQVLNQSLILRTKDQMKEIGQAQVVLIQEKSLGVLMAGAK